MRGKLFDSIKNEPALTVSVLGLVLISYVALSAIAPFVFPVYFVYFIAAIIIFVTFSSLDFDILRLFSPHLYTLAVLSLIFTLVVGQITRGAVRWIQIGPITIQPTELIRPFLILFFADFLTASEITPRRIIKAVLLLMLPVLLILFQPSLGVSVMTVVGFVGVGLTLKYNKKNLLFIAALAAAILPVFWFILAPYQKIRVQTLLDPAADPSGAGYNSIQSQIAVGSGEVTGRGLGEGVQTQLAFLPERHTDFIFASIGEEMGFVGIILVLSILFFCFYRVISVAENSINPAARAYVSGVFLTLFVQSIIHIGMNMGMFPITGLPLPVVSAGGSSLIATATMLGIVLSAKSR